MNEAQALEALRALVDGKREIYTLVRSVSRSGLSRRISLFVVKDGEIFGIDHLMIAAGLGKRRGHEFGLYVEGVGQDMAWYQVYRLSLALYGDAYRLTDRPLS